MREGKELKAVGESSRIMDTPVPQTLASNRNGYGEMQLSKQSFCAVLTPSATPDLVPTASMILRIMQQLQGWVLNDCVLPVCSLTRPTVPCPFARCNETLEHGNAHTSSKSHKRTSKKDTSHRTDKRKPTQKPTTRLIDLRTCYHCQKHWSIVKNLADAVVEAVAALTLVTHARKHTPSRTHKNTHITTQKPATRLMDLRTCYHCQKH